MLSFFTVATGRTTPIFAKMGGQCQWTKRIFLEGQRNDASNQGDSMYTVSTWVRDEIDKNNIRMWPNLTKPH